MEKTFAQKLLDLVGILAALSALNITVSIGKQSQTIEDEELKERIRLAREEGHPMTA